MPLPKYTPKPVPEVDLALRIINALLLIVFGDKVK